MQLAGLPASNLMTVFGAVAGAIVLLHMMRRRRETRVVPFVEIFVKDLSEARRSTWIARYLAWLSLLILLAITGLLVMALGDPRRSFARGERRTTALFIDVSRSMATRESGGTRLSLAKKAARRAVRAMREGDRAIVVSVSADPEARTALTDDRVALLRAIDGLRVEDVHDDYRRAADLANDILARQPHPEVLVFGDGANLEASALDGLSPRIRLRESRIGRATRNVGIRAFSLRRYPRDRSESEILVSLENTDREPRRYELVLSSGGETIDVRALELAASSTHEEVLRHIAGGDPTFEARIRPIDGKPDALARDDHAFATLPERRRIRTLLVTADNLFLEAALLIDESIAPTTVAPSAYTGTEGYDVAIFDGFLPTEKPSCPVVLLHPVPTATSWAPFQTHGERTNLHATRVERNDRLLEGIDLDSVTIDTTPVLVPTRGDQVLASAGTVPLLVRGEREGTRFLALSYDTRASDLPMHMAFPVLLVRALESLTGGAGDVEDSFRTDSVARIPLEGSDTRATVVDPSGRRSEVPVVAGRAIYRPREVGFFHLTYEGNTRVLAASLGPASEIAIGSKRLERRGGHVAAFHAGRAAATTRPWTYLVLAAFGILCFEWWSHHRRWTS